MRLLSNYPRTATDALFLQDSAYDEMLDQDNPFVLGLVFIVVMGVAVALANIVGNLLEWASLPSLPAIKEAVWESLGRGPWLELLTGASPDVLAGFRALYDWVWRIWELLAPNPWRSITSLVTTPLGMIVTWLIYGVLAHGYSRLLGGQGSLAQTYGCVALGYSTQMLRLANLLPFVSVGSIVPIWGLVCNFIALKRAHKLKGVRAFWAAILPTITMWLIALILVILMDLLLSALLPGLIEELGRFGGAL